MTVRQEEINREKFERVETVFFNKSSYKQILANDGFITTCHQIKCND